MTTVSECKMNIKEFKLLVISPEFTDTEVKKVFESLEISSEDEIKEAIGILRKYRPRVADQLKKAATGQQLVDVNPQI